MIKKYVFGNPFDTEAIVKEFPTETSFLPYFNVNDKKGLEFTLPLLREDAVYGLGEANRGINKRGYIYDSYCSDDPNHTEATRSLYGAHSFLIIESKENTFGVFFDCPSKITFDIGFTERDVLRITTENPDIKVYIIENDSLYAIVKEFRKAIGQSYIPPLWAFGYTQSRWSYLTKDEVREVVKRHRDAGIPLDGVYLDIDYMERYKDFTVGENFENLPEFVKEMKEEGVRLVPIIDAGVKIEKDYDIYEEGVEKGYFCKDENGEPYAVAVWPGLTHFPDFLNPNARKWFGQKYKILTDMGIEGFWNDMNEPAIFWSQRKLQEIYKEIKNFPEKDEDMSAYHKLKDMMNSVQNSQDDYNAFYHDTPKGKIRHNDVHNLYGYNMTRSAGEALSEILPNKRTLLFSRASYIGMHRHSGIWTGDNHSWWSHILLLLKQLPSLNMCGFLYVGADLGGFGCETSRDLLLRFLSLGIFTPLMRNHSAAGTRYQECYRFEDTDDFKHIIELRYRLIPYLYSEYMKAALADEMFFRPLAFEYPEDNVARHTEDQLLIGNEVMIAPVYTQNALGRYVYLPENMTEVRMHEGEITETFLEKGHHFVEVPESDIVFFIRSGKAIPLCKSAKSTMELERDELTLIGDGDGYLLYTDDGESKNYSNPQNFRHITK